MPKDLFRHSRRRGYALAIAAWGLAFGIRYGLAHWFPPGFPYLTFFPAVVLVAYYAGLRPAILTAVLSGLTAWWFWIGPTGFDLGVATMVALGFYAFVVAVDIFFIVGMDGARRRLATEVERSTALAESRDLLMKEVQHRVSNNIQVVSALLAIEARGAPDAVSRKAILEASGRTALIAGLQRRLAGVEGRAPAFGELAREVVADALQAAGRRDIEVEMEGDPIVLTADEATPLILILLESVNNALEHGFADRAGRVAVALRDEGASRILTVTDDGRGLPEGFSADTSNSLGLRIIRGLTQQLQGRWTLESRTAGAVSRLTYPRPEAASTAQA
jgi:two-component sensor histidine kinase